MELPFAALRDTRTEISASGSPPVVLRTIPLTDGAQRIGELVVGLPAGRDSLDPPTQAVLELLAAPLSVAVLAADTAARGREDRLRLRHEVQEHFIPALAAAALRAELAGGLVNSNPARAIELLSELRQQTTGAIDHIHRSDGS